MSEFDRSKTVEDNFSGCEHDGVLLEVAQPQVLVGSGFPGFDFRTPIRLRNPLAPGKPDLTNSKAGILPEAEVSGRGRAVVNLGV